jgi:iron complex outermembrane recepter protein
LLDLLNGAATGSGGGNPRHEIEFSGGLFYKGIGWRLEGNYRSATRVDNNTTSTSGALYFGNRISLNNFLFINLDQRGSLTKKIPMLKGSRIAIRVLNVFDDYIEVKDANGLVPISYQRGLIEPVGRSIEVSFRKKF